MKSILLPTDFSKNSINAIEYAVNLFKDEPVEFFVLNIQKASTFVSDDLMSMTASTTIYQTLIDTAKKSINNLITTIKAKYPNPKHEFHPVVDYDNFIDGINQMCHAVSVDLIVMGTHGATGAERVLFGSNTVRVMQRCSTPVLAIPENYKYNGLKRVVFTSNYQTHYKPEELSILVDLAEKHDSNIDVLHLAEEQQLSADQKTNKKHLDSLFKTINHEFIRLVEEDLYQSVQQFIQDNDVQLLAMMGRKHSFIERLFTTHNVELFGFKITIPFLVMENTGTLYPLND